MYSEKALLGLDIINNIGIKSRCKNRRWYFAYNTHDYYKRDSSEKQIEEFCYSKILYLDIFLESSKDNVILKYKENAQN